jgi:Na+-transporting NADH:ubiquinone oxidoreductase subunit C
VHKNSYVFVFAAMVTITCSILLTSSATLLRDRQQENIALDMRKNIIAVAGISDKSNQELTRQDILGLYDEYIKSLVIDLAGNIVPDKKATDLNPKKDLNLLPLYYSQKNDKIIAYIVPISGKGLWSTIYGYLSLEPDAVTVKGITFYKHGETPGLGGEIEKPWFKDNFVGKKIVSPDGKLVSISVVKGKVAEKIAKSEAYHYVDGISGSTLTGKGLTKFLKEDLQTYEPYFSKVRNKETE